MPGHIQPANIGVALCLHNQRIANGGIIKQEITLQTTTSGTGLGFREPAGSDGGGLPTIINQ